MRQPTFAMIALCSLGIVSIGLQTTSPGHAQDVLKVGVEIVQVYATVTDVTGRFVTNLKSDNFAIKEDGKDQQIEAFASDDSPLSVGILFDVSGTMGDNIPVAKQAALAFLKAGNLADEYFLLEFNNMPRITEDYTHDLGKLENHVQVLHRNRDDGVLDAINLGLEKLREARNPRKVLLVFTSGGDLKNQHKTREVRSLARQLDVQIFGIAIPEINAHGRADGFTTGLDVMDSIGGEGFAADTGPAFLNTGRRIAVALRNQYIISYRPTNPEHDGKYRHLQVRLAIQDAPELIVHTREGYYAVGPEGGGH